MAFIDNIKNELSLKIFGSDNPDVALIAQALLTRASGGFNSGYHLEFVFGDIAEARALCEVLAQYDVFPKLCNRRGMHVVYIKNSDCICNLLAAVSANKSLLALHDEIALRDVRNTSNRRTNCDTANIVKQVNTAQTQIEHIQKLQKNKKFNSLDAKIKRTANARLGNPNANYEELAKILDLSKATVARHMTLLLATDNQTSYNKK